MKASKRKPAPKLTKADRARAIRRAAAYRGSALNVSTSLPVFVFVGVLFTGVGLVVSYAFRNSEEVVVDYTRCTSVRNSSQPCGELLGQSNAAEKCWCEVPFRIENDMNEPLFLYYGSITIFEVRRRPPGPAAPRLDDGAGDSKTEPRDVDRTRTSGNVTGLATSGAPANTTSYSISTDTLTVFSVEHSMYVRLNRTGMAWPDVRCGRCGRHYPTAVRKIRSNSSAPGARSAADSGARSLEHEDFMVWMQPIVASTFGKLYRKANYSTLFNGSLPKGDYRLLVAYTHPVAVYGGGKSLIVANSSILGAKNRLLGIAFVATGGVCLIASIIICALRLRRKMVRKKKS